MIPIPEKDHDVPIALFWACAVLWKAIVRQAMTITLFKTIICLRYGNVYRLRNVCELHVCRSDFMGEAASDESDEVAALKLSVFNKDSDGILDEVFFG